MIGEMDMNYVYLMVVSVYVLIISFKYIKPQISEIWFRTFTIFLGLSMIFFVLIDVYTIKPRPDPNSVSGNGNLGLAVLVFLIPIFIFWLGIFSKSLYKGFSQESPATIIKHLLNGSLLIISGIFLQIYFVSSSLKKLVNHEYNPFEEGYRGSMINQYTNTLFFNGSTYGIVVSGVLIVTLLVLKYKKVLKHHLSYTKWKRGD